jgi:hypothetical protein
MNKFDARQMIGMGTFAPGHFRERLAQVGPMDGDQG